MGADTFNFLAPAFLMEPAERRKVRRYLSIIEVSRVACRDARATSPQQTAEVRVVRSLTRAESNLEALAWEVLYREVGVERFMVLHIQREGGYEAKFQALSLSISNNFSYAKNWGWLIEGYKLKRDGTIGLIRAGIGFDVARIYRRKLDGSWERLSLRLT